MENINNTEIQVVKLPMGITKNLKVVVSSALMIIFFFIPWIDLTIFKFSGWELPSAAKNLSNLISSISGEESSTGTSWLLYLVYLIPLSSACLIYLSYKNDLKYSSHLKILIATITLLACYQILVTYQMAFATLGFGIIFTAIISLYLLSTIVSDKHRR